MGVTDMISEKIFARNYTGFWNALFPLNKAFLKGVLLECSQSQKELKLQTTGRRVSFVSEVGYQLFAKSVGNGQNVASATYRSDLFIDIENTCTQKFKLFNDDDPTIYAPLSEAEFDDVIAIALVLERQFTGKNILVAPKFNGCSVIDTCYGDVLANDILYEIKSVNRNFNVLDFRQLITYCALNHVTKEFTINSIGLFNPKKGLHYTIPLGLFASAIAGAELNDLYWEIINFISQDDTSK